MTICIWIYSLNKVVSHFCYILGHFLFNFGHFSFKELSHTGRELEKIKVANPFSAKILSKFDDFLINSDFCSFSLSHATLTLSLSLSFSQALLLSQSVSLSLRKKQEHEKEMDAKKAVKESEV